MKNLNAYEITWTVLTPVKGKVTKKDLNQMYRCGIYTNSMDRTHNQFFFHSATKENAQNKVKALKGLSKTYEVIHITDKQFGLLKWNESKLANATKKQLENRIFI